MSDGSNQQDAALRIEEDLRTLIEHDPTTVPDYSQPAIQAMVGHLPSFHTRLAALNRAGLTPDQAVNIRLVEAEINAFDFFVRTLQPFMGDPNFYLTVFAEQSDTAEHEGLYASVIDLWRFKYPLSASDSEHLEKMLKTVPPLLEQAQHNLTGQARDLFTYGVRAFREQAAALRGLGDGSLVMNSLAGKIKVDSSGHSKGLLGVIDAAAKASEDLADWIAAEAPKRNGGCGIGKEMYSWAAKNVYLLPYDWDAQVALLQRELDRSWAALAYEEFRNRKLPPQPTVENSATHDKYMSDRADQLSSFLIDTGFVVDKPYYRAAIPAQTLPFTPSSKRDFFRHIVALDPMPLQTHFYHWIDLARVEYEPRQDPIRRRPPVLNVWQERCEGMATAMEELLLQAGLYDDVPRTKELVWIMLANRAARGLAALYVQANMMTLEEAGQFHATWTPRKFSDPLSPLVTFEQLLYARQPGYGASYIIGKLQLDGLISRLKEKATREGKAFDVAKTVYQVAERGFLPFSLIEQEMMAEA